MLNIPFREATPWSTVCQMTPKLLCQLIQKVTQMAKLTLSLSVATSFGTVCLSQTEGRRMLSVGTCDSMITK
ncbi:hypothetical protein SBA3_880025 [Candidatus Sulfopaludibacter sp. SbA3]|nr:hypothetical protein SBA3_880025 [Candidatus Sulfopaludibacter sp. SbA3]